MAAKNGTGEAKASPPATNPKGAGRPCSICAHPARVEIDADLVAGDAPSIISRKFDVGKQSLIRHRDAHVPTPAMREGLQAVAEAEALHGAALIQKASSLLKSAELILSEARAERDNLTALRAIREAARCVELCAKLAGEISDASTINVAFMPVMVELQQVVLASLSQFPEARAAVIQALAEVGQRPLLIEGH